MSRRDDPGVGLEGLRSSDAFEFAALEDPKQLGLGGLGKFAHLVEKDRSSRRTLESAGTLAIGPGEAHSFVAEELALDEAVGQCSAIDPHERTSPRREWVCRAEATSSFPVPLSPTIRTGSSVAAARPIAL